MKAKTLKKHMNVFSTIMGKNMAIPVIENICLSDGRLTVTDLVVFITADADGMKGELLFPFAALKKILPKLDADDDILFVE